MEKIQQRKVGSLQFQMYNNLSFLRTAPLNDMIPARSGINRKPCFDKPSNKLTMKFKLVRDNGWIVESSKNTIKTQNEMVW